MEGQIRVLSTCSQSLEGKHQTLGVSAVLIIESSYTDKRDSILKINKQDSYLCFGSVLPFPFVMDCFFLRLPIQGHSDRAVWRNYAL